MQEKYYAASPYNLIPGRKRAASPERHAAEQRLHARGAENRRMDRRKDTGARHNAEHLRLLAGIHRARHDTRRVRLGFIALGPRGGLRRESSSGTSARSPRPKADRIELLRQTRAQTGQLFMLYDDPTAKYRYRLLEETVAQAPRPSNCATNTASRTACGPSPTQASIAPNST